MYGSYTKRFPGVEWPVLMAPVQFARDEDEAAGLWRTLLVVFALLIGLLSMVFVINADGGDRPLGISAPTVVDQYLTVPADE